ncbi:hypothetical protein PYJP_04310 [Pyrofollis japonicus]|uniref:DUF2192 domain-containing protein n=1 Tax=Pyrofollis japonicus TaxID=3060460 RepID=UPI00295BD70A|nr:DUF2192 domain-containing protein [Pyrofollis japonicus]BEP17079.1 hypothetical protein PYJP_04310 [Pyrofollis japonicus]
MESLDPRKARESMKNRINAAMEVLSQILQKKVADRETATKILEETYRKKALQPLRGKAWPPDIWDKEMATLYVIGKYALMLNEENPDLFHKLFNYEETLEEAAITILLRPPEEARKFVLFLLGGHVDDNTIARMLRVVTTKVIMGFEEEDKLIELLQKIPEVLPEQERTVRKYARFYIALRLAQAIASKEIRSRIAKEAFKQALAARIGLQKIMPDDEYIAFIATNVFEVPRKNLLRILGGKEEKNKRNKKRSAAGS